MVVNLEALPIVSKFLALEENRGSPLAAESDSPEPSPAPLAGAPPLAADGGGAERLKRVVGNK